MEMTLTWLIVLFDAPDSVRVTQKWLMKGLIHGRFLPYEGIKGLEDGLVVLEGVTKTLCKGAFLNCLSWNRDGGGNPVREMWKRIDVVVVGWDGFDCVAEGRFHRRVDEVQCAFPNPA